MNGNKKPKIDELMQLLVTELINEHGAGFEISSKELKEMMAESFGVNQKSTIPSDYCYNKVNSGDIWKKPLLFAYDFETGLYKCLGPCKYDGDIYHKPKGSKVDIKVGVCKEGKRNIYPEYMYLYKK